jgi:flagellar protein FliL
VANPAITEDDVPEAALAESESGRKWSGKKLVLMVVVPAFLVIGGGMGIVFSGMLDSLFVGAKTENAETANKAPGRPAVFFDLPEILVNLNSTGSRASFLKITVSLEIDRQEDIPRIREVLPRIMDNFQVYLRELRLDDLRGSAGMYRLREELLARVNAAVAPVKVRDVLFKEMLVQ